jgi:hypothetical protein
MRYEIDETNTVRIYTEGDVPAILQDINPNGSPWASKAEATKWADAYIVAAEQAIADAEAQAVADAEAEAAAKAAAPTEPAPADPAA